MRRPGNEARLLEGALIICNWQLDLQTATFTLLNHTHSIAQIAVMPVVNIHVHMESHK